MNWTRKDLIAIKDLQPEEIVHVLDTALTFEEVGQRDVKKVPALRGRNVVSVIRARYEFTTTGINQQTDQFYRDGTIVWTSGNNIGRVFPIADYRASDYKLTLLQKTAQVELEAVDAAIKKKEEADLLLNNASIETIDDIQKLQEQLRVVCKDLSGPSEIRLPEVVRLENPLFAVFAKLFDWRTVGFKELFLLVIAFLMDLGDIIGYTLVPNRKRRPQEDDYSEALFPPLRTLHSLPEPEPVDPPALLEMPLARKEELRPEEPATGAASNYGATPHQFRSQRFRIRQR